MKCQSCSRELSDSSTSCSWCGATVLGHPGASLRPTESVSLLPKDPAIGPARGMARTASADALHEGRFPAGTLILGRFQVTGLVGKGGMGEVYRAYDLKLEQWVALKFLPEATALKPATLARIRSEVRIARQGFRCEV